VAPIGIGERWADPWDDSSEAYDDVDAVPGEVAVRGEIGQAEGADEGVLLAKEESVAEDAGRRAETDAPSARGRTVEDVAEAGKDVRERPEKDAEKDGISSEDSGEGAKVAVAGEDSLYDWTDDAVNELEYEDTKIPAERYGLAETGIDGDSVSPASTAITSDKTRCSLLQRGPTGSNGERITSREGTNGRVYPFCSRRR